MDEIAAAFAPLDGPDREPVHAEQVESDPVIPAHDQPPADLLARNRHRRAPDRTWLYRLADGTIPLVICRWNLPDGKKDLRQLTPRASGWVWKGHPEPRPLYGLDQLATRPDAPVLVVEGEKTSDAARRLVPGHVVITWPGGSQAVAKADWQPMAGRAVTLWPDADDPGRDAMAQVRDLLDPIAASVAVVDLDPVRAALGGILPQGWDLADAPPTWTPATVADLLAEGTETLPRGFYRRPDGIWHRPAGDDGEPSHVCGPLRIAADTRDESGRAWGRLLAWRDREGRAHEWAMPAELLAGDGTDLRRTLLDGGLSLGTAPGVRSMLARLLMEIRPGRLARCVTRGGWHGDAFVLRDRAGTVIPDAGERVVPQGPMLARPLATAGTLDGWRNEVAALAVGNSRLLFAIGCGFAGPLLNLADLDGGGFHLRGGSSLGKTRCVRAAASVFGSDVLSWRATANGLEGTCAAHNDSLLCLDELGQADAHAAGEVAYLIANGRGKSRMRADGGMRDPLTWRLLLLSTGEIGLADLAREAGKVTRAGADLRIADIPADAGAGLGAWETTHDTAGESSKARGAAFADRLDAACHRQHGTAGPAFLHELVADLPGVRAGLRTTFDRFAAEAVPAGADGQVHRVARRFAVVAAAGELATAAGITGWPDGAAFAAAASCFKAWLSARRGGAGAAEDAQAVEHVRGWLVAHGSARFDSWDVDEGVRVQNRAGWYRIREGARQYLIPGETWRAEVCKGLDPRLVARACSTAGMLIPDGGGKHSHALRLPREGGGTARLYVLTLGSHDPLP
ncbi:hypothetical protein LBMAG53_22730 [Planctomycetota bacterium]|nr:hypothetical protein LBMAG53_22730 [Planctomycetota bacterium]